MERRRTLNISIVGITLLILAAGLWSLELTASASADIGALSTVVTLSATADTTLYEENGLLSNGQGQDFYAGKTQQGDLRRALLNFDVAGNLPPNALILSATLQLNVSKYPLDAAPEQFSLHRATAAWGEGASDAGDPGGKGADAQVGDATWAFSYFSPTATERISWTIPGGDFLPTASASAVVGEEDQYYTWGPTPAMLADLGHWLKFPDDNHGWILLGNELADQTARRFDSRENSNPDQRPVLYLEYIIVQSQAFLPLVIGD